MPEETQEWFEKLCDLLKKSAQLTTQEEHEDALAAFVMLYEVIEALEEGEEIVSQAHYADDDLLDTEETSLPAYVKSLAATSDPEEFAEAVILLIKRRSLHSGMRKKIHRSAMNVASDEQKKYLKSALIKQKILITPT